MSLLDQQLVWGPIWHWDLPATTRGFRVKKSLLLLSDISNDSFPWILGLN